MTVVLTRPTAESEALARSLASHGIDSIIAPMLSIVPRDQPEIETDLDRVQAVLLTSVNGARALAEATNRRDVSLFVVGDATAVAARSAGFTDVASADGDAAALVALVTDQLTPDAGPLLHISGGHVAGDLEGAFSESAFTYQRMVLYDAVAATDMPENLVSALNDDMVSGVLLFSPRTSSTFVHLAQNGGLAPSLKRVTAYCLSDAVAAAADRALWRNVMVSARPRADALIDSVVADLAASHRNPAPPPQPSIEATARPAVETGASRPWRVIAGAVAASALVAILVALGVRAIPEGDSEPPVPVDLDARLQALEARGGALADRMAAVEARGQRFDEIMARLDAFDAQITALSAGAGSAVDADDLAALTRDLESTRAGFERDQERATQDLTDQMTALSEAVAALTARVDQGGVRNPGAAGALLLAVGQLRAAALGPGPFSSEIDALRAIAGDDPAIAEPLAAMAPLAVQGAPTVDALQADFHRAARAILRAEEMPDDAGWLETAYAEVKGLVTVRRVGETVEGDDPEARLARAEAALARGDVAGAVALVEAIANAEAAAGDWLANARARAAVSTAIDAISSAALARAGTATPTP